MNDIANNIKKVLMIFLLCFIILISYITYFEIFQAPKIAKRPGNRRLWVQRNEVLRGTIFDRNLIPLTKSERVDELNQKRTYTGGPAFAHVLGYVNIKYGITGLERKYDEDLMTSSLEDTIKGYITQSGEKKEKVGKNVITTLDMELQTKAYEMLGDYRGAVVVLNPKTGEILAMVSKPSFDPNNLEENWENINSNKSTPLLNRAVAGLYPPGSTFKTITAVSALENIDGVKKLTIEDNGKLVFNSRESLSNYNGEQLGTIDFKQAFVHSSNVYFGDLGGKLGNDKLKATAEKFYFNKDTPADGITIENSKFPTLKKNEVGNIAQSAIGQGAVLASPIEMALVAATIANDGVMMKPYLVKQVTNSKGDSIKSINPEKITSVMSSDNAKYMKDLMRGVVTDGTGGGASVENLQVCGKTGTADHHDEGKNAPPHSWFIGFAPYSNPNVAVAVIVEDGGVGGGIAAEIAGEMMRIGNKKTK